MLKLSNKEIESIKQSNLPNDIKEKLCSLLPDEYYFSQEEIVIDELESVLDSYYDTSFDDLSKDQQNELLHQYHHMSFQHHDEQLADIIKKVIK